MEEAGRRRSVDFLKIKAPLLAAMRIENKHEALLETLNQARARQFPWMERERPLREAQEMEAYEEYYERVATAYKEFVAEERAAKQAEAEANNGG